MGVTVQGEHDGLEEDRSDPEGRGAHGPARPDVSSSGEDETGAHSRLEHAEAERFKPAPFSMSVLRPRDDVVPRRREEGRDLVLDRAVRLIVGRQERPDLGVRREAVAQELDGTRLRD